MGNRRPRVTGHSASHRRRRRAECCRRVPKVTSRCDRRRCSKAMRTGRNGPPPPTLPTAGSAPAISARSTTSGYVRITGRVRDVINRGGEKIPVAEVEQLLSDHPAVAEVAIVAMPDRRAWANAPARSSCCAATARSTSSACSIISTRARLPSTTGPSVSRSSPSFRARRREKFRSTCCASGQRAAPARARRGEDFVKQLDRAAVDEAAFAALKAEISAYVAGPAERWAERIERERRVPPELWDGSARARLSLARRARRIRRPRPAIRALPRADRALLDVARVDADDRARRQRHLARDGPIRYTTSSAARSCCRRFKVRPQDRLYAYRADRRHGRRLALPASTREGDTYHLSGEKHLITFGTICDYWLLFARLDGTRGAEGTVALLVDRHAPDATVRGDGRVDGRSRHRSRALCVFDRTPVPVANRLGDEGQGLESRSAVSCPQAASRWR